MATRRWPTIGLRREVDMLYNNWNAGNMSKRGMSPNKDVFGPTKGPQKVHYKQFKDAWSSLDPDTSKMTFLDAIASHLVRNSSQSVRQTVSQTDSQSVTY